MERLSFVSQRQTKSDSRVQGRTDFTPAVISKPLSQPIQLIRITTEGPCKV
jgi:hypothetical protein